MKIRVEDIKESEKEATFLEDVTEINEALARTGVVDFQFTAAAPVDVHYYRVGPDLFFHGRFQSRVAGTCARCLENYPFSLGRDFTFVLKPETEEASEKELSEEDLALSFYHGEEVDLAPLVRETMILALPTRPLCREDCRGLCAHCGANLNTASCGCRETWTDPRFEVLRSLKR